MSASKIQALAASAWPMKFRNHNFDAYCFNTRAASIIYNRYQFSLRVEVPSGPPPEGDYRARWHASNIIEGDFPGPVRVDWRSLDGAEHHVLVDLAEIFKERLVLHRVRREDIPEGWLAAWGVDPLSVDILMELNDRTISLFMKAHVTTKERQIVGNPFSTNRRDLIQAWTRTY